MDIRPEYQNLIDQGNAVLPESHAKVMANKIKRWSEYADVKDEFFNRPGHVTSEEKLQELAEKYNYSQSNISKIVYTL